MQNRLVKYPEYPEVVNRDYDYEVTVTQGEETISIPVYNAARQHSSFAAGKGDSYRRFCEFAFEGEVKLNIKVRVPMTSYAVLPSVRNIQSEFKGDTVSFKIDKPQNLVFRLDGDVDTVLAIFADEIERDAPSEDEANVVYFKAGLNNSPDYKLDDLGRFHIPANSTVYLAPGALVMARTILGGDNVTITGQGAFMDPRMDRKSGYTYMFDSWEKFEEGTRWPKPFENLTMRGVRFLDAHCFNLTFGKVNNIELDNIKILANQISTDGISFWDGQNENVDIHGIFVHCSDDVFVLQSPNNITIRDSIIGSNYAFFYPEGNIEKITVENISLFRPSKFIKCWVNVGDAPTWKDLSLKNIYCDDPALPYTVSIRDQKPGMKNIAIENVSFPEGADRVFVIQNSQGVNIKMKNAYIGNDPITGLDNFTDLCIFHDGNKVSFENDGTFTPPASPERAAVSEGTPRVYVGGYCLPVAKIAPYIENGEIYLPKEVVYCLNIGEIKCEGGCVTAAALREKGLTVVLDGRDVKISAPNMGENLIYEPSFEECKNSYVKFSDSDAVDYFESRCWNTFDFGTLRSGTVAHSGERSLLLEKWGGESQVGVAQFLTPALKKYGTGTYRFECWARLATVTEPENNNLRIGIVQGSWHITSTEGDIKINDFSEFSLGTEWQKITYDVTITDLSLPEYERAYLYIGPADEGTRIGEKPRCDFYIDDVSVTYLGK